MNTAAYVLMVVGILLAKGLGFFRDMVFAKTFGATELTDIYFNIFTVVNLCFTGIGTAMQTLVIKQMNKGENAVKQKEFVAGFIRKTTAVLLGAAAVLYVFAKPLTNFLVPGISAENFEIALHITYVMLPSLIFVVVAYIISGVLQNNRVFFITSVMSLPFNVILIAALFFPNIDIFTLSIITTIGWFLHIVVQLPNFYKLGFRLFLGKERIKIGGGGNREVLLIFISNMMFQLCFLLDKIAASGNSGASSVMNYASNLFITIASVFVVAMSSVVFPSISRNYEEGNVTYVRKLVQYIILIMLVIFVPFILTTACFGTNVISLVYERGEFTHDLAVQTGLMFAVYTMSAAGYLTQELFNKVLYLDAKYKYTVIGTVAVVGANFVLNSIFEPRLGVTAVVVITTVLMNLYAVNVAFAMKKVIGNFFDKELGIKVLKVLLAGGLAAAAYFVQRRLMPQMMQSNVKFILPLLICGAVYGATLLGTGIIKELFIKNANKGGNENE